MNIDDLLRAAVAKGASDLHIKVGAYPMARVSGMLVPVTEEKRLMSEDTLAMGAHMMSPEQRDKFIKSQEVDLAYSVGGLGRFRVNIFQQRGTMGMVLRVIPTKILTVDDLLLPPVLRRIADEERGLVLVTGTTGSGKSTTLAAMIDHINNSRCSHVMTVEDPIEFLHRDSRSIVNQREVSVDTRSFAQALRSALRQDPDVILVGEMRDFETIETALLAAETGHLVFSTLHTLDATETINRIIAVYPPHQQKQVRLQLAAVLRAVISQRLIPRVDTRPRAGGRSAGSDGVHPRLHHRQGKDAPHQRRHRAGHVAVRDADLRPVDLRAVQQGFISLEEALRWASNVDEFKLKVQGISTTADAARDEMARSVTGGGAGEIPGLTRFGRVEIRAQVKKAPPARRSRFLQSRLLPRAPLADRAGAVRGAGARRASPKRGYTDAAIEPRRRAAAPGPHDRQSPGGHGGGAHRGPRPAPRPASRDGQADRDADRSRSRRKRSCARLFGEER